MKVKTIEEIQNALQPIADEMEIEEALADKAEQEEVEA